MAEQEVIEIREQVRRRYAEAATAGSGCGCGDTGCGDAFGSSLYGSEELELAADALGASLGCGNPTAVAELHPGEIVLDLGSGAGGDVLVSARRVAPGGKAYGVDMTDEMLELARRNAEQAGADNVEFLKGLIEEVPLPDASVDVVISNCVINLSADKRRVFHEAARVLRPGGRLAVTDIVADEDMDPATRADMAAWTGCIAGALTREELLAALSDAGFEDIEVRETHRVHEHAGSAIIRARRPAGSPLPTVPSFCSLTGAEFEERIAEIRRLGDNAELETRPGGVRLRFERSEELAAAVRDLVRKERDCCPTLEFELSETERKLTLDVTALAG